MAIISISGKIGSGKDTVAEMIQNLYPDTPKWEIRKFADKLKQISSLILNIPVEKFEDQEFKKLSAGPEWDNMTYREILQRVGTDCMRQNLHKEVWANALAADYTSKSNWIVTDTRFPNEIAKIKQIDPEALFIRIKRSSTDCYVGHESELALDHIPDDHFDAVIYNDLDLYYLRDRVQAIYNSYALNIYQRFEVANKF
jgi:hypothetical protein